MKSFLSVFFLLIGLNVIVALSNLRNRQIKQMRQVILAKEAECEQKLNIDRESVQGALYLVGNNFKDMPPRISCYFECLFSGTEIDVAALTYGPLKDLADYLLKTSNKSKSRSIQEITDCLSHINVNSDPYSCQIGPQIIYCLIDLKEELQV